MPSETLQRDGWYVLLHVANYHDNSGGIWNNAVFESGPALKASRVEQRFRFCHVRRALIIGSYHLVLFAQRRDDLSALFFALFA